MRNFKFIFKRLVVEVVEDPIGHLTGSSSYGFSTCSYLDPKFYTTRYVGFRQFIDVEESLVDGFISQLKSSFPNLSLSIDSTYY